MITGAPGADAEPLEWVPWGQPRLAPRGLETAFHHPLIVVRLHQDQDIRIVNPAQLAAGPDRADIAAWRPLPWAAAGRRDWPITGMLNRQTVFAGADGHLFHTINAVCEQLFEPASCDDEAVQAWREVLTRRVDWCSANGIVYRHLVVPEHHAVYSDKIPDAPRLCEDRPIRRIMHGLPAAVGATIVYPLDAMIAGRVRFATSLPHDVHFSGYGAYLCYRALMQTVPFVDAADVLGEDQLRARDIFVAGDVAHAADQPGRLINFHEPPKVPARSLVKGSSFKTNQVDVLTSDAPAGRRLVLFRTSNSTRLIPYLLQHFSRITAVATTNLFHDLIASEQPDLVIAEMPERYLAMGRSSDDHAAVRSVPDDDLSFAAQTGHSLPLPPA